MSRKESLKKSLGISEYPWSSDDEEMEVAPTMSELHSVRQQGQSDTTHHISDAPGPSGTSSASSSTNPGSAARRRNHLFWSFYLGNTQSSRNSSRTESSRSPRPPAERGEASTSAASAFNRGAASSAQQLQRFIALRKINRGLAHYRANKHNGCSSSSRNGPAPPAPALPPQLSAIIKTSARRNNTRWQLDSNAPTLNAAVRGAASGTGSAASSSGSGGGSATGFWYTTPATARAPASPASPTLDAPEPVTLDASDDDDEVFLSSPARNTSEINIASDAPAVSTSGVSPAETHAEAGSSTSDGNNTLPIVEVKSGSDDTSPNTSASSDKPAAPGDKTQKVGGKRKRDSDDEGTEIVSVREFNQSLLRLLECPVCLEWMEPPMSQCRRGHLVCGRCRARLASCPVCRTAFSSVRNRAMEGVAEMVRYPCRHGCGREVRLRLRPPHEASCAARRYRCPAAACAHRPPLPHRDLAAHLQSKHPRMVLGGWRHSLRLRLSEERHEDWVVTAQRQLFHLRLDVDIRTWGLVLYVAYIGPKCNADHYTYEVTIVGQHNYRKISYTRATHCDLECSTLNVGRQDCFHITLEQALNFLRESNKHDEHDKYLFIDIEISRVKNDESADDASVS